jgi:hypothetical protein
VRSQQSQQPSALARLAARVRHHLGTAALAREPSRSAELRAVLSAAEGGKDAFMSSKHRKRHGRLPPFVPILRGTLNTPAWKATTYGARALYIALKRFLNENIGNNGNNGKIYRSDRDAAEDLGTGSPGSVVRWFRELEHYGFIVKTAEGCLGVDGDGTAPHWRLTECACDGNAPTRDFEKWDGVLFDPKKIESRDSKSHNPCPKESHTGNPKRPRKGSRCERKTQKVNLGVWPACCPLGVCWRLGRDRCPRGALKGRNSAL